MGGSPAYSGVRFSLPSVVAPHVVGVHVVNVGAVQWTFSDKITGVGALGSLSVGGNGFDDGSTISDFVLETSGDGPFIAGQSWAVTGDTSGLSFLSSLNLASPESGTTT